MSENTPRPRVSGTQTGQQNGSINRTLSPPTTYINPRYAPGGISSLVGIAAHGFGLGAALGTCGLASIYLAWLGYGLWRAPFFISVLALFHFLEFFMTAKFNAPDAETSSFLLLSNGKAYSFAHLGAITELFLRYGLGSRFKPGWIRLPLNVPNVAFTLPSGISLWLGFSLIIFGQVVRSLAMREAKTSFNHLVQFFKKDDHVLVTTGVYRWSRHPSYCGFFYFSIGTQLVLGNKVCLIAYMLVLWKFFEHRIRHEERHLVSFFGQSYIDYRRQTPVLIPFI